ncbi:SRPBCC family protein [Mucilaginibacter kameinonensis]|uniref:SRPBCC family protein n=1 Tax=Mucilaginibacter kameinonensis TaxID=452286 RepID=UPI000EF7B228|nr:SRPBCC domain-containing protein [Mucilaginibacter kameinonensis]
MSTQPFVIERIYAAPIQKVWEAITVKEKMKEWYFDLAEFKPEVGFEFQFIGGDGIKEYLHLCRVTKVVEGKTIAYTWRYDGYEGDSEVTWELSPEGEGTKLVLTHRGLETFPPLDAFKKENFVAGWTHITGISLKEYLEK